MRWSFRNANGPKHSRGWGPSGLAAAALALYGPLAAAQSPDAGGSNADAPGSGTAAQSEVDPSQSQAAGPPTSPPPTPALDATHAEPATVSGAAPVSAPPASADAAWHERYGIARSALLDGEFARAETLFEELDRTARTNMQRALAREQARLAAAWAHRGVTLEFPAARGAADDHGASASDRRSTDELVSLYSNATFYGLGTGLWLAIQTKPDTAAGGILPALGFAGAAVGAVAWSDRGRGLPYGVPQSIVSGLYVGLEEGIALVAWNDAGHGAHWNEETNASVVWGGATIGAAAGGLVATLVPTTPGEASWVGSGALWAGLLAGLVTGSVQEQDMDDMAFFASSLAIPLGAALGAGTARHVSPSVARSRLLDLGGIAGGLVAGGLYLAAANDDVDGHALAGVTAAGMAGGLVSAWLLTASMRPDPVEKHLSSQPRPALAPFVFPVVGGTGLGLAGAL